MANLSIGIVGLPNVGKSTLFNSLTEQDIPAENYPFCTIDPNTGIVPVPDERLDVLAKIANSARIVPAVVEFVDIAGLVEGASKGEGLGNQFLANIREVDVIVHVLRFFTSEKVTHVSSSVDPNRDKEVVEMELMLKDLETVEKRIEKLHRESRVAKKGDNKKSEEDFWQKISQMLEEGVMFDKFTIDNLTDEEKVWIKEVPLLSTKKVVYLANTGSGQEISSEDAAKQANIDLTRSLVIPIDVAQEADLIGMSAEEQSEYVEALGLKELGLHKLIKSAYKLLGLITFFTAGEMEARAWTIKSGTNAQQAAGVIHTDFSDKFIAMDVIKYDDFVAFDGWLGAKEAGKINLAGRDYMVQDGDVVIVKHNA